MAIVVEQNDISTFYFFNNPLKPYLQTLDSNLDGIPDVIVKYKDGLEITIRNDNGKITEIK